MSLRSALRTVSIILLSAGLAACGGSGSSDDDKLRLRDLNGTWTTPCLLDVAVTLRGTLNIDDGEVILETVTYLDMACTMPAMSEFENFDIALGDEVTVDGSVDGIVTATELDITNTTPMSPENGDLEYNLVAIKNDSLYLGDTEGANDGSSPALRPTQLDGDIEFIKCNTC